MKRTPERVGDILARVLKEMGIRKPEDFQALAEAWREVAGEEAVEFARVVSFRGGVVTVEVSSAPLRQELEMYRKEALLRGLRERVGSGFVQELRFRLV